MTGSCRLRLRTCGCRDSGPGRQHQVATRLFHHHPVPGPQLMFSILYWSSTFTISRAQSAPRSSPVRPMARNSISAGQQPSQISGAVQPMDGSALNGSRAKLCAVSSGWFLYPRAMPAPARYSSLNFNPDFISSSSKMCARMLSIGRSMVGGRFRLSPVPSRRRDHGALGRPVIVYQREGKTWLRRRAASRR